MRNLLRDKQTLYYALYKGKETVYKLDENGDKIVSWVDDSTTPPTEYYEEIGIEEVYHEPVKFKGNIAMSGGDSQAVDFGVSQADYEALLLMDKSKIPITETSLIWYTSEPKNNENGHPDPATADFRVIKVSPSINIDRYVLAKVVK